MVTGSPGGRSAAPATRLLVQSEPLGGRGCWFYFLGKSFSAPQFPPLSGVTVWRGGWGQGLWGQRTYDLEHVLSVPPFPPGWIAWEAPSLRWSKGLGRLLGMPWGPPLVQGEKRKPGRAGEEVGAGWPQGGLMQPPGETLNLDALEGAPFIPLHQEGQVPPPPGSRAALFCRSNSQRASRWPAAEVTGPPVPGAPGGPSPRPLQRSLPWGPSCSLPVRGSSGPFGEQGAHDLLSMYLGVPCVSRGRSGWAGMWPLPRWCPGARQGWVGTSFCLLMPGQEDPASGAEEGLVLRLQTDRLTWSQTDCHGLIRWGLLPLERHRNVPQIRLSPKSLMKVTKSKAFGFRVKSDPRSQTVSPSLSFASLSTPRPAVPSRQKLPSGSGPPGLGHVAGMSSVPKKK